MSIDYFDTYVRTDTGFVAVKDDFVCICTERTHEVLFYRNRQGSRRCIAYCGGGSMRWCRERAVEQMKKLIANSLENNSTKE